MHCGCKAPRNRRCARATIYRASSCLTAARRLAYLRPRRLDTKTPPPNMIKKYSSPSFYEFFAGGGMARAGFGAEWTCLFANDFDPKKSRSYEKNWGTGRLKTADV